MATQAELIKDCMLRIKRLELALKEEPENKQVQILLQEEQTLLEEIKKAN